jgi:hypothetical protein
MTKDETMEQATVKNDRNWDLEADVVIIGSGRQGFPPRSKPSKAEHRLSWLKRITMSVDTQ